VVTNSAWRDYETDPPPLNSVVLVYLSKKMHGSRIATLNVREIANGARLEIIGGHFKFDMNNDVLCWRALDDVAADLPMKYTGE
jgi:hypothetical protein